MNEIKKPKRAIFKVPGVVTKHESQTERGEN